MPPSGANPNSPCNVSGQTPICRVALLYKHEHGLVYHLHNRDEYQIRKILLSYRMEKY